ncbi:MAG: hypothetical protein ABIG29_03420 [Candidatus Nealsonbacteria bacterium]
MAKKRAKYKKIDPKEVEKLINELTEGAKKRKGGETVSPEFPRPGRCGGCDVRMSPRFP